jgi:hypothetical protein
VPDLCFCHISNEIPEGTPHTHEEWGIAMSSRHPTDIPGFISPGHAAQYVENLRYDSLALFLLELKRCLMRRAESDYKAERYSLASKLDQASSHVGSAYFKIDEAWSICKPHMRLSDKDTDAG